MAYATLQTFALYFLKDVVGLTNPAPATAKFSIVAAAGTLAFVYPAGYLSDKVGRKPVAMTAGTVGILGVVLVYLFQHSLTLVILCGGLIGISLGAFMSTNWALAVDLVPRGEEARYLGLTNIATAGGAALARLMGPLIDFFNASGPNLGYRVMLLACLIYFAIGTGLLVGLKGRN
jgi:MFS family permease